MRAFSPDAAAALPGPGWLRERRVAAAGRAAAIDPPSAQEEIWRYSRIDEFDLGDWGEPGVEAGADPGPARRLAADVADPAAVVLVRDGVAVSVEVSAAARAAGLRVGEVQDADEDLLPPPGPDADLFDLLTEAFAQPVVVAVPRGALLSGPVVVAAWSSGDGSASFPMLVVDVGEDAQVEVVELSGAAGAPLILPTTRLHLRRAARAGYLSVQRLGRAAWQLGVLVARAESEATVRAGIAAFGGGYARLRTDCELAGRGATGELLAAYFGDGDQTLDFRTFQDHSAPDTTSELVFKGALAGASRSVYTGLIRVGKQARGTNAFQTNRNLKLSDGAWAESVPNLVIENNDVRCSHASAVGPIDPEQRFYLESRGVPSAAADRLIVGGFFDELVARLPVPALHPAITREIAEKLEGSVA